MKKGDVVIVRDSSYSRVITKNGLEGGYDGVHSIKNAKCKIIEVDCEFSDRHKYQRKYNSFNNTVIMIIETGEIAFIEERFLEPATHRVMVDVCQNGGCPMYGKIVEISDKLYKEIKRDS